MKEMLHRLVDGIADPEVKRNTAREYLQARILQCLQDKGAFTSLAFLGGTALRFLYSLPRYSEDLDFSTTAAGTPPDFRKLLQGVKNTLSAEGYMVSVTLNDRKTVFSSFIKFAGLPNELGISPMREQVLSIKLEADTNPPAGAMTETTLVRRHIALNLHHYDRASLLAGKIHALLCRPYAKGRDVYDLVWYLADRSWPAPNFELLNAALQQTNWTDSELHANNWKQTLGARMETMDWNAVREDVRPFLERTEDMELVDKTTVLKLLA